MRIRRELLLAPLALTTLIIVVACSLPSAGSLSSGGSVPYPPEVVKGAKLYVDYACVQCHGLGGRGRGSLQASEPSLTSDEFKRTFPKGDARYDEALVNVIRNGAIIDEGRAASMPAWNGVLSDDDMRNIVAYIRAGLPVVDSTIPRAGTGEEVYIAFACVKCHGELGKGGVRNVAASTPDLQTISALGGPDFKKKFDSSEKIRAVVLNGRLVDGGRPGVVYMPAWGKIGTADQIEKVMQYITNSSKPGG